VWGGGVPSPLGKGSGEGAQPPLQNFFFLILDLKMAICGAFLVQFFCSSAKTLRGRKDTLAQVYFYWGGNRPPPGIDATGHSKKLIFKYRVDLQYAHQLKY